MSHQNLKSGIRSGEMIRENGRNTMIRKAYWGVLASILVALAFATGCSSTSATPPTTQVVTVTAMAPFRQTQVVKNTTYVAPLTAAVTTSAGGVGSGTPAGGVTVTFTVSPSP